MLHGGDIFGRIGLITALHVEDKMTKTPFNRLVWLTLRASTALMLTIAPYHLALHGAAKLVPAAAHAESEGGGGNGGGGGDGGHDGGNGGGGNGGGDGGEHDGGDSHSSSGSSSGHDSDPESADD
ncbi:hypothetical protein ACVOMV_22475 [Mesorhizobium atlanticum]